MIIDVEKFSVVPDSKEDMTPAFNRLFKYLSEVEGEKEVVLPKGQYDLYCDSAEKQVTYISNTLAEREVKIPLRVIAMHLKDISDLTLDGSGSKIIIHGKSSNMFIENCKRVRIKNLTIDRDTPAVSQIEIVEVNRKSAVIRIHPDCRYVIEKGRLAFVTDTSKHYPHKNKLVWWYGVSENYDTNVINRTSVNPFSGARATEIENGLVKLNYVFAAPGIKKDNIYHIHIKYREEVGIFCNECKSIAFENVHELSNYSHAFIFQHCKDIELKNVSSAPEKGSKRIAASQTDCIHCSMCEGLISVTGSKFEGAFDDVLNVHGFHFKVVDKGADSITVKFMHPQAYGFKPFDIGDKIITVKGTTLIGGKEYEIKSAEMLDLYRIKLVLKGGVNGIKKGEFIEDITKCADVIFKDNYCTRIPTRGVLVTTRGKVLIENNVFDNTQMSGVLISDDAKSWFESGAVRDVTIRGNKFIKCGGQGVLILPENRIFEDYVHSGIVIEGNEFTYDTPRAIYAKNSRDIKVSGNMFIPLTRSKPVIFDNCAEAIEEGNIIKCAD